MAMGFTIMFLGRVSVLIPDQKKSKAAAKSVFRIIDRKSKIDSLGEQGLKPNSLIGHVRFENVYFNYPTRPDIKIMQGFSLECKPNETNALVGPSGNFLIIIITYIYFISLFCVFQMKVVEKAQR